MSKSIYPSIPAPGNDMPSLQASLGAMRQTLNMLILNAQNPNPNFSPSSASQVFVTHDQLKKIGIVGEPGQQGAKGEQGLPGPPGQPGGATFPDAPNDGHNYARLSAAWSHALEDRVAVLEAKFPQSAGMVQAATTPDTTSTTYVMQGINLIVSTVKAARAWATADGQLTNLNNNGQTNAVLCWGTGTPPINGAPQAGTILTQPASFVSSLGTGRAMVPFSLSAVISGLTPGVPFWVDLAVSVSAGSQGNVIDVNLSGHGIA